MRLSWEEYALKIAEVASLRSEDPFVKVGCCALRYDNSIASVGYNGAPSGIDIDWSDRDGRRKRVIHAELNCLKYTIPGEIKLLAVTLSPCSDCLKQIAAYKIPVVVYKDIYEKDTFSEQLAKEFNITLKQIKV